MCQCRDASICVCVSASYDLILIAELIGFKNYISDIGTTPTHVVTLDLFIFSNFYRCQHVCVCDLILIAELFGFKNNISDADTCDYVQLILFVSVSLSCMVSVCISASYDLILIAAEHIGFKNNI